MSTQIITHPYFSGENIGTVQGSREKYSHSNGEEFEVFDTKKALRRALSRESGGAWIEEKSGKKRYYIDDSGWFNTSFKQVSRAEYLQKQETPSTLQKVLGIGLGILALAPGISEFARRMPIGTNEAVFGLIAMNQKSPALGLLGCSLIPSQVQAQALGTEFQVNTNVTGSQVRPRVASLKNGGFIVTWHGEGPNDSWEVFSQRYRSDGQPVGPEYLVSADQISTFSPDDSPVTGLTGGNYVVVWVSEGLDGNLHGVFGQMYRSDGLKIGEEFQINTTWRSIQNDPNIASLQDGGFIVVWNSLVGDGDQMGIFAQRFDSDGSPVGEEFQVNSGTAGYQENPSIGSLPSGEFAVAYDSLDTSGKGIYIRFYNQNGGSIRPSGRVNSYTLANQDLPRVAGLNSGDFVVVWNSDDQDGSSGGIYGRMYGSDGLPLAGEFRINTETFSAQQSPSVASLTEGGYVVTWQSERQDGDSAGIIASRYDALGNQIGTEFVVNSYTLGYQSKPDVTDLEDGGYVIVWESRDQDGNGTGIFGQRFDSNSTRIGTINETKIWTSFSSYTTESVSTESTGRTRVDASVSEIDTVSNLIRSTQDSSQLTSSSPTTLESIEQSSSNNPNFRAGASSSFTIFIPALLNMS